MNDFWEQLRRFLASLFSSGKQGVETLAESIDRQAAIQRLAAQGRGLARERNELLLTIGRKVYSLHQRGKVKNRDVMADCKRLDLIGEELHELKHQIEEIRLASMADMEPAELLDDSVLADEDIETPETEAAAAAPEPEKPAPTSPSAEEPAEG
ncbi:MAG TPA: hypothetical protein VGM19_02110 [Armatimonadota bacterium]|jgi:hypothetical protein